MKKTLILFYLFFISAQSIVSQDKLQTFPADLEAIRYVGRTISDNNGLSFGWSGTYLCTMFSGSKCDMKASDTGESFYNIFIDGELKKVIRIASKDTLINIASGLDKGFHRLKIQKRSEGEFGKTTIHQFMLAKRQSFKADTNIPVRFIEFIGDSFTCGYGIEGKHRDEPFLVETENSDLTYACTIARYFDADYTLIAHSGRGAVRNYGDSARTSKSPMRDLMLNTFDNNPDIQWNFKAYKPSLVVINLGSNDFSTKPQPLQEEYTGAYKVIISQLREKYGDIPILCIGPRIGEPAFSYIKEMCEQSQDKNLFYTGSLKGVFNNTSDLGAAWHPGRSGHLKMAMFLIPYISTVMGWELTGKTIF